MTSNKRKSAIHLDYWPTWHIISGGPDFPLIATNGRKEFIRSDVVGCWHRCNAAGEHLGEPEPMPGILKLRTQLRGGVMFTTVLAPFGVVEFPGGVLYRGLTEIWEQPDGSTKVGDTWHMASGFTITTDDQGVQHVIPPEHWNIPQQ